MYRIKYTYVPDYYFSRLLKHRGYIQEVSISAFYFWKCSKLDTAQRMLDKIIEHEKETSRLNGSPDKGAYFQIEEYTNTEITED